MIQRLIPMLILTFLMGPSALAQSPAAGEAKPPAKQAEPEKPKAEAPTRGLPGRRTLVDTLDEKVPLDVGVQLRIFRQARDRKAEVDRMEGMLDRRSARLKMLMTDIEARYKTLRMLQSELAAQASEEASRAPEEAAASDQEMAAERADKVVKLSKVFNKMKVEDAAKMVPSMDEALVVEVMAKLKPKQAAKILGKVEPEVAARLTGKMAAVKKKRKK